MSTKNPQLVKEIFEAIKSAKGFRKNTELAEWLGTTKQNITNWAARNSIPDYDLFTRAGLSEYFMRTGNGCMLEEEVTREQQAEHQASANFQAGASVEAAPTVHRGIEGAILDWLEEDIFPDPAETLALVGLLQREYACFRKRTEKRDGGDCELKRMA